MATTMTTLPPDQLQRLNALPPDVQPIVRNVLTYGYGKAIEHCTEGVKGGGDAYLADVNRDQLVTRFIAQDFRDVPWIASGNVGGGTEQTKRGESYSGEIPGR